MIGNLYETTDDFEVWDGLLSTRMMDKGEVFIVLATWKSMANNECLTILTRFGQLDCYEHLEDAELLVKPHQVL